jgi:hypothetical protein
MNNLTSLSRAKIAMQFGAEQLLLEMHTINKHLEAIHHADAIRHLRVAAEALGFELRKISVSATEPTPASRTVGLSKTGGSMAPLSGTATTLMSAMEN